jgi:TIR domain
MVNGANEPPQDIFISYRREGAGAVHALLLRKFLEQYLPGTQVFKDTESIQPGDVWEAAIEAAVRSSAVMLVVIGPNWLTVTDGSGRRRLHDPQDWVRREIELALDSDIRVIPVLVEGVRQPPSAGDLPPQIGRLASRQATALDILNDYEGDVSQLALRIDRVQEAIRRDWQDRERLPAGTLVVSDKTWESIPGFVAHIRRLREGHPVAPANAMATLRVFAERCSIDDLLNLRPAEEVSGKPAEEEGRRFAPLDAVAILTLAAVDRPPKEAAKLAVELRRAEGGPSGLTASIVHDLAAQRTVPDVAEFIAECERLGEADLMVETVAAFVGSRSRVSLDKALLYFELLRVRCAGMADELLAKTLDSEGQVPSGAGQAGRGGERRPLIGVIGEVGVVGALRHLSPTEKIVEDWIAKRMAEDPANWDAMVELVARLLRNEPNGDELLARHVARRWRAAQLVQLCGMLVEAEGSASPGLRLLRRFLAEREHELSSPWVYLADVIGGYYTSPELADTFPALLVAIVAGGEDPARPCPIGFLRMVADALKGSSVPAQCRLDLLVAAATRPERRPGADVAKLLIWVGEAVRRAKQQASKQQASRWPVKHVRRAAQQVTEWFDKDLWRVALQVNKWYADDLVTGPFEPEEYIKYLTELRDQPTLTFWAVRELTDPAAPKRSELTGPAAPKHSKLTGEQIGDIAVRIYVAELRGTAFDLLERYLENEQAVTWQDVMDIVGQVEEAERLRNVQMRQDQQWTDLLGATIGRWTDTDHLQEVWEKLRYGKGRETKHQGRDYTKEAAAIMSLSQ